MTRRSSLFKIVFLKNKMASNQKLHIVKEGVLIIQNEKKEVVGFIHNDLAKRNMTFYKVAKMGFDDIEGLFPQQEDEGN